MFDAPGNTVVILITVRYLPYNCALIINFDCSVSEYLFQSVSHALIIATVAVKS